MSSVLVIDDEPVVRRLISELLVAEGHGFVTVEGGEAALAALDGQPFDLVLMDLNMPGLAGAALVEAVHEARPELPVLLMTGGDAHAPALDALGAVGRLEKPFTATELLEALASALRGPTIGVLVVEDHPAVRASLVAFFESQEGMTVVGEAQNGWEAVKVARERVPDFVLMDIRMPVMDGIEGTRMIKGRRPETRVVLLSAYEQQDLIDAGMQAGADGFLLKGASGVELAAAARGTER